MTTTKVYEAISAVMQEMSRDGISKDRKNQQQGYSFRGIDDVYNALCGCLVKHKLLMLPRVIGREQTERQTKNGGALFYTIVHMEFDLVSAEDGSKHTISMDGEAMDSADKSTNKAQSAAFKYAAMQAFCIPTEGDNDADSKTHEVAAAAPHTLPAAVLKRHTDAIRAAKTTADLKTAYSAAYRAAHAIGDTVAEEVLAETKDARKIELEGVTA